jgi:hypothetical protein
MQILKRACVLVAILGFSAGAAADEAKAKPKRINPWQDCGLGAMVFPEYPVAAAVSNIIWDLGTTAISSKISSDDSCAGERLQAALFIKETYHNLTQDVANGQGDHLAAVLDIYQCDASARSSIVSDLRKDYAQLINQTDYAVLSRDQKAAQLFDLVTYQAEVKHASACHA